MAPSAVDTWMQIPKKVTSQGLMDVKATHTGSMLASLIPKAIQKHDPPSMHMEVVAKCKRLKKAQVIMSDSEEDSI